MTAVRRNIGGGSSSDAILIHLIESAPAALDLTDPETDAPLEQAADLLLDVLDDRSALAELDVDLAVSGPVPMRLATKLALSKRAVGDHPGPGFVSIVFAVYQEHHRIKTRDEHPDGEDFLNRKLRQMLWLFDGRPDLGWELIVVDDGCPDGSGHIAQEIIERGGHGEHARVLFLQNAIDRGAPVTAGLGSAADSRKGGSILLGMWEAIQTHRPGHAVVYTDADLSTHLGQSGLLLNALASGAACAAGSRREPTSAVVKSSRRDNRGKLFIYLWKRLLTPLGDIVDTQCGFKAFPAPVVADIVLDNDERQFAFDIELLLRTLLGRREGIEKVAVAWIDSEALSTTADLQPYLPMLQSIVKMYRRYLEPDAAADEFAVLIDRLDPVSWERLLENIPDPITSREPAEFGEFDAITTDVLAEAAGLESTDR